MREVTDDKLEKYFSVSERALAMAKENVNVDKKKEAEIILDMASRYIEDAKHFLEKDDKVTSFAALNYAHGWLDCGAMLGFFNVTDNTLFTVD
uniref:DUF357 domain-containing protein n=1 Tax=uncultured marine group II/III euryarchaeote KM3_83_G03 TaxID=1456522 RepID=A0A075HS93_9EURY|nr:hypothetical protein conserved in archaea [uncultured marine group II/III euryarchaeote KM3_83_G03]